MTRRSTKVLARLPLILGIVGFLTMTLILGEISEDIINHEPLTQTDVTFSNWLHSGGTPQLTTLMFVVTALGSTIVATLIAFAFGIYLIIKRRFAWVITFTLSVVGGALLNRLLKYFFHRPRPEFDDPILKLTSYSFPSGHTMLATVLYGTIAAYCFANTRDWRKRILIVVAAGVLILMVAFSRIYLGAHYLSDVLGAMAEGLAWLSFCLTALHYVTTRRRRAHLSDEPTQNQNRER